jgi:hydroxyethylthiazole kinase-like uncharacterized protein yjeF
MTLQPLSTLRTHALHDAQGAQAAERAVLAGAPPLFWMQRAGRSLAQLAMALVPHGQLFWIACGPGNNGGDGLMAALHLHRMGRQVWISRLDESPKPGTDAAWAFEECLKAGLTIHSNPPTAGLVWDLSIDALFGLGAKPDLPDSAAHWLRLMREHPAPLLCADLPSGLCASTGRWSPPQDWLARPAGLTHTLCFLTLKSGLFTASGPDASGHIWFDDLGAHSAEIKPVATLLGQPPNEPVQLNTHKGMFGHVWVVGGDQGMSGAAWLAGQSALRRGAGRVHVQLLSPETCPSAHPLALMQATRPPPHVDDLTVVAGCGGGQAIARALPHFWSGAKHLVLDADALNALACDPQGRSLLQRRGLRGKASVLTPHPLEAARLLNATVAQVQSDRLQAARELAQAHQSVVVLKGAGTVLASPEGALAINPTGSRRLSTPGSGDVLAGWIAARLAQGDSAWAAACHAVYAHGLQAQNGPQDLPLIADWQ